METLSLSSNSSSMQESKNSKWTNEQNTWFESALAIFDTDTPDRWSNVAALVPGKSEIDVKNQYEKLKADINEIEAGLVPDPGYFELVEEDHSFSILKRPSKFRSFDQERRKGVPWTEEEHRRFLMGLQVHGKGDWRSISRNFVMTKTPTQVASHAQKYYARQHADGKEKRRPSIHDITIVNLPADSSERSPPSINKPLPKDLLHWNHASDETHVSAYPFEIAKMNKNVRVYNSGLRLQPTRYQVRG